MVKKTYTCLIVLMFVCLSVCGEDVCTIDTRAECEIEQEPAKLPRYLLYDVNPSEGFNLRRDVYMRLAVFMRNYSRKAKDEWYLVLPPWDHLYHWQTKTFGEQKFIPWSQFFDVDSLNRFAPVVEMDRFLSDVGTDLGEVYVLQHYPGAFTDNWNWEDKWSYDNCKDENNWEYIEEEDRYLGLFWGYTNLTARDVNCVSFQGGASLLSQILDDSNSRSIVIHHAEIVLHDQFGDKNFWDCRRSMRFATPLVKEAAAFRKRYLKSTDSSDATVMPDKWENLKWKGRKARGGPYLCVHLRRRDFLYGRSAQVPSLEYAADQIANKLSCLNLSVIFLSTDAPTKEVDHFKDLLREFTIVQYKPDAVAKQKFKDGGIAIIDQIICSHARFFVGTHESTFSFRIQEEREILGFPHETTFNRLCGEDQSCPEPSKWKIVIQ